MARQSTKPDWSDLLSLAVDRDADTSKSHQLYEQVRQAILSGTMAPADRLPATRRLAAGLGMSRSAVVAVYERLLSEGYVTGRPGAGTFVSNQGFEQPARAPASPQHRRLNRPGPAERYARLQPDPAQFAPVPFNTGRCTVDGRTLTILRRLATAQLRRPDPAWLGYRDPSGSEALRHALARYLRVARAVQCDPEQIMVLSGTQQAVDLVVKVLIEPDDPVWIEDPTYPALHAALQAAQARVVPVRVDAQGLVVADGIAAAPVARAVYVTPSHQSPTGVVMSMARRLELLAWARDTGAWIIEDDYDSEFRYAGPPLASLQGIDRGERVIYLGTFSKVIAPGLRLGYAVIPYELLEAMRAARFLTDRHAPGLTEAIVTQFIEQGHFGTHLRRMCAHYRAARDTLVTALAPLAQELDVSVPDQGMYLTARLLNGRSDVALALLGSAKGVVLRPMSRLYIAAPPVQSFMLGFTGYDQAGLEAGVSRLAGCFREEAGAVC